MTKEQDIKALADELERVRPIAEWLAIDHDKTRLQWNEHIKDAGELLELIDLLGYRLPVKHTVISDEEIKKLTGHIAQYYDENPNDCEYSFNSVKKIAQAQVDKDNKE